MAHRRNPGAQVIPCLLLSSTDAGHYRALGVQAYGFEPYALTEKEADLSHSNDEHLRLSAVTDGVELLIELIRELHR